jgi:hypothetical protein
MDDKLRTDISLISDAVLTSQIAIYYNKSVSFIVSTISGVPSLSKLGTTQTPSYWIVGSQFINDGKLSKHDNLLKNAKPNMFTYCSIIFFNSCVHLLH